MKVVESQAGFLVITLMKSDAFKLVSEELYRQASSIIQGLLCKNIQRSSHSCRSSFTFLEELLTCMTSLLCCIRFRYVHRLSNEQTGDFLSRFEHFYQESQVGNCSSSQLQFFSRRISMVTTIWQFLARFRLRLTLHLTGQVAIHGRLSLNK